MSAEPMPVSMAIALTIVSGAVALARPRVSLYMTMACVPSQFLFVPIKDFFISPSDVLIGGTAVGLAVRLVRRDAAAWNAIYQHRFVVLMVVSYLVSFAIVGTSSRTLVRVPMAALLSVSACELLQTRPQLARAAIAMVVAGVVEALYGLFFAPPGLPGDYGRFSGMSGVNFSAMTMIAASTIALALSALTKRPLKLLGPGLLAGAGLATLSITGVFALLTAWLTVLRQVVSRTNKKLIAATCILSLGLAMAVAPVRERILNRIVRTPQWDGVARNSIDVRWMLIETAWQGFLMNPIGGLGYSNFRRFSNVHPDIAASTAGWGDPTHNTYLEVLVEGGLMAFAPFMLHWWHYIRRVPLAARAITAPGNLVVAASLVGLPVALVSAALANLLLVYSFWALSGLALACLNLLEREEREPQARSTELAGVRR